MSYIGAEPIVSATRTITEVTATAGQTVFTANGGYTVGFIDVFVNGSKLTNSDFTATNGTTITLNEAAQASDIVRLEALGTFNAANIASGSLTAGGPTWSVSGGVTLPRVDSSNEGGQLNFNRASDNTATWSIDSFGNTSTPSLRFLDGANVRAVINGSGNVGIGTSAPTNSLSISNSLNYAALSFDWTGDNAAKARIGANHITGEVQYWATTNYFPTFYSNNTEQMRITTAGLLQFNSGYGSVATAYGCRAWVNFNGTGTVAIRASGNVSSITDNGQGDYTVNFTTAMPDSNYTVTGGVKPPSSFSSTTSRTLHVRNDSTITTSSVRVVTPTAGAGYEDFEYVYVLIHR